MQYFDQNNVIKLIIVANNHIKMFVQYADFNRNKQVCKRLKYIITALTKVQFWMMHCDDLTIKGLLY